MLIKYHCIVHVHPHKHTRRTTDFFSEVISVSSSDSLQGRLCNQPGGPSQKELDKSDTKVAALLVWSYYPDTLYKNFREKARKQKFAFGETASAYYKITNEWVFSALACCRSS